MTVQTTAQTPVNPETTVTASADGNPIVTNENKTVESPIVTTPEPAPVTVPSPAPAGTTPDNDPNKATPEWAQKRINELTAKRYEAERIATDASTRATAAEARAAEALAQVAANKAASPTTTPAPAPTPAPQLSEAEIERRAEIKAVQKAQQTRFNEACEKIVNQGEKEFKDFGDAIKNLGMVGAIGDKVSPEFLETAVELNNPHKVLHHLGMNPDMAAKIAAMPPKKMALEMARLEATLDRPAPAAAVSSAPAPIIPVTGAANPALKTLTDPDIDSKDWFELRARQIEEKRNRYKRN